MADQTKSIWVSRSQPGERGTGVYAIPDERVPGRFRKIYITDITLDAFKNVRVPGSANYQWVPRSVADFWSLSQASCGNPCSPSGECVEPGCICQQGLCV